MVSHLRGWCIYFCMHLYMGEWDVRCALDAQVQGYFLQILFDQEPYHLCKADHVVLMAICHKDPWTCGDTPLKQILASCCCQSSSDCPSMSHIVALWIIGFQHGYTKAWGCSYRLYKAMLAMREWRVKDTILLEHVLGLFLLLPWCSW